MRLLLIISLFLFSACTKAQTGILGVLTSTPVSDTIYLSQQGILSDADLSMNSATFGTDQTAAIQAVFNGHDTTKILAADVRASATQLKVKSGLKLYIPPTYGFIQRDNTNLPFLVNVNRTAGTIVDKDIRIYGGGIINGNGYRGGVEKQVKETMEGWAVGLRFAGVRNLRVENITFLNCRSFASFVTNFEDVTYTDVTCTAQGLLNQDGCKFMTGTVLRVTNLTGNSLGDDVLSIVANDIFYPDGIPGPYGDVAVPPNGPAPISGGQTAYDPWATKGLIDDFVVDGVVMNDCQYGIRFLSGDSPVGSGTISNVSGTTKALWLIMDNYSETPGNIYGSGSGTFGNITFTNVNVSLATSGYKNAYAYLEGGTVGTITFSQYVIPDANLQPYAALKIDSGTPGTVNINLRYVPDPTQGASKITNLGTATVNYTQY